MKYLLQSDICHSNSFYLNFYFQKLKSINNWRSNGMKKKIPLQILSLIHKIKSVSKVIKAFCSTTKIPFVTSFPYKQPPPLFFRGRCRKKDAWRREMGFLKKAREEASLTRPTMPCETPCWIYARVKASVCTHETARCTRATREKWKILMAFHRQMHALMEGIIAGPQFFA